MRNLLTMLFGVCILLFAGLQTNAQDPNTGGTILDPPGPDEGIYAKNTIDEREYLPYTFLREADVMWSKTIWRKIDLREKINLQFYYPQIPDSIRIGERMNLINTLIYGIQEDLIRPYVPDNYHEFKTEISLDEVFVKMGGGIDTIMITDINTGELVPQIIESEPRSDRVKEYLVKELWFFDRKRSQLEVRLIGICPIYMDFREDDIDELEPIPKKLFWVYYPDARYLLSHQEVFNWSGTDAERRTYDDVFINRYFSSYIVQESNMYNNRSINEYSIGVEALLEAERIKNTIFDFEQDLWEY